MQTALCQPNEKQETEKNIYLNIYIYPQLAIKIVYLNKRKSVMRRKSKRWREVMQDILRVLYFIYLYNASTKIVLDLDFIFTILRRIKNYNTVYYSHIYFVLFIWDYSCRWAWQLSNPTHMKINILNINITIRYNIYKYSVLKQQLIF